MTTFQRLMKEHEEKGRAQTLLELLDDKFGPLTAEVRQKVGSASLDELQLWTRRILRADELDEVFDGEVDG